MLSHDGLRHQRVGGIELGGEIDRHGRRSVLWGMVADEQHTLVVGKRLMQMRENRLVPPKTRLTQALALHQQGDLAQAKAIYTSLLEENSANADAWHLLGMVAYQEKNHSLASDLIRKAIAVNPNMAGYYSNLGLVLRELGQFESALANYQKSLAIRPGVAETYNNQGIVYAAMQRYKEAIESYDLAIRYKADYAPAHYNLGNALFRIRKMAASIASYDSAIRLKSDYYQAFDNRGIAFKETGQYAKALADHEQAIRIKADYVEAHYNRALVLCELKDLESAAVSLQHALTLSPGYPFLLGAHLHNAMQLCSWQDLGSGLQSLQDRVRQANPAATPFVVTGLLDDPALHREVAQKYIQTRFPQNDALGAIPVRALGQKIRIGYFSADFRNHAIAYLVAEMLEKHDKNAFEIYAFKLHPGAPDETSARIFAAVAQVMDLSDKSDKNAAQLSRALNIDIAIDLGGHTVHSRIGIFAHRCAPLQVNYLGFPGTLGAPYYDYILADANVIPEDQRQHYLEKVVYLPHCYQPNDAQRKISERVFSRNELGLPDHGFIFCCFNNGYKIVPQTFDGWMRILRAVEGSVLWLLDHNPVATRNLQREAQARGIHANRLIFAARMPLADHLARHRLADLFIDTLPYNAHTTASDALWAGLPVLTCMGTTFAARVAGSLLLAMNLPELITHSRAAFEARAIELAKNPTALGAIKSKLLAHRETSPLFNAQLFARHIEAAYRTMQSRQQAGLLPENFAVSPGLTKPIL
jgi:tetratricopeptide (TPR) repeat protein